MTAPTSRERAQSIVDQMAKWLCALDAIKVRSTCVHNIAAAIDAAVAEAVARERERCWEAAMAAMGSETNAAQKRVSAAIRARSTHAEGGT